MFDHLLAALASLAMGGGHPAPPAPSAQAYASAQYATARARASRPAARSSWEIGPFIRGRDYSVGMPPAPTATAHGWFFDFPGEEGDVHYVTTTTGSLAGKSRIVLRYRIDAAPGVAFVARGNPNAVATLSLYFQRAGDNWSGRRQFEHFRWYALESAGRVPLSPGEHEASLPLDPRSWKSVMSSTGADVPEAFRDALANASRVGFVLGGSGGAGHGVYATGPARFTLLSFRVE